MPRKNFHSLPIEQCRRKDAGTMKTGHGYVLEYCPEHPCAEYLGVCFQYQHRLVVEEYLGRELEPDEIVHHCNHQKDDNDLSNLDIALRSDHMRHHGKQWHKNKPLNDPEVISQVYHAANDKSLSKKDFLKDFPHSLSTLNRILDKYHISWKSPFYHYDLDPEYVEKVLQSHSRRDALKILGCSVQYLWNRFPEAMRKTANRKLKSYQWNDPK